MGKVFANRGSLLVSFHVPRDGRRVRWRYYFGLPDTRDNRRRAEAIAKEIREMIAAGRWADLADRFPNARPLASFRKPATELTFRELSERFLAQQKAVNAESTFTYYADALRVLIWPTSLAAKPARLITAGDITLLLGEVKCARSTYRAKQARRVISAVFGYGLSDYLVDENPVRRTKAPRTDEIEETVDPFTKEEVRLIIDAARKGRERRIVTVALGTGMRPGETFGLKRENVDLAVGVLYVRQTVGRRGEEGKVKTPKSRRTIQMTEPVRQALKEQLDDVQLKGPWVWLDARRGKPHSGREFARTNWSAILRRAGVTHRNFYQCRHTYATLLLAAGADWTYIADQMGHTNLTMLQKHYLRWKQGKPKGPGLDVMADALGLAAVVKKAG
jgi:integrase